MRASRLTCARCNGMGWLRTTLAVAAATYGQMRELSAAKVCPSCKGKGHICIAPPTRECLRPTTGATMSISSNPELIANADAERQDALAAAQREEMERRMRAPLGNVSSASGEMERNAPLFFGTGDNPTLF